MDISITKIDAARRQLNEAIRLWFLDGDPIAIHCLACSAYQIIHDINQQQGGRDLLYDSLMIKEEYREEWARKLKAPYNFIKHADKDSEDILEFKTEITEFFILFSLLGFELLGQKHDEIGEAYLIYLRFKKPHLLTEKGKKELSDKFSEQTLNMGKNIPKADFFKAYVDLRKQIITNEKSLTESYGKR